MKFKTELDLKAFFDTNYKKAVVSANRLLNNQPVAEDVVQDCLIKLWDKREELIESTITGYFFRMVRNRCIDILRNKQPETVTPEDANLAFTDHSNLELNELKQKINSIIDGLPNRCREIFVLSRFEKMSYKEIARTLSISPKTVENQISRALKVLSASFSFKLILLFLLKP